MIALLVLIILSFSIKSQLSSCLPLETLRKDYKTDLSECYKLLLNPDSNVQKKDKESFRNVISCEITTDLTKSAKIAVKVVKLLDANTVERGKDISLIDNELITLDKLNRLDNIWLPLYYGCIYDSIEKTVYIFMEHLDTTLTNILNEYSYTDFGSNDMYVKTLELMLQIARGVEGLHSIGMVHNHIAFDNIRLDKDSGVIKLVDFGYVSVDDHYSHDEGVMSLDGKAGFDYNLKRNENSDIHNSAITRDLLALRFYFLHMMELILDIPIYGGNDSLMSQDNQQLKRFVESIYIDKNHVKTIASVVSELENMIKDKGVSELLDKDEFSKNYRLKNAAKFNLDLFQLKAGSKGKYEVESFEVLKAKVKVLEETNVWPLTDNSMKTAGCGGDCRIFRRLLI